MAEWEVTLMSERGQRGCMRCGVGCGGIERSAGGVSERDAM
jgi:hypothetical protein